MAAFCEFKIESLSDTDKLAARFAQWLCQQPSELSLVAILTGPLGAGKTQFVRCLAKALNISESAVVSPTFSICQTYEGVRRVHHLDVYRVQDVDEFLELGPEEWLDDEALSLIEWGERFLDAIPQDHLQIEILPLDIERRLFRFHSLDTELAASIRNALETS